MKTKPSRSTALLVTLALSSLAAGPHAQAQDAGQLLFVQGDVQIRAQDGSLRPARKGDPIRPGEQVVTGEDAMSQVKLVDGGYVGVRPESSVRFEPRSADGALSMELGGGGVRVLNTHLGPDTTPYTLKTPHGEVSVRGGDAVAGVLPGTPGGADGTTRTLIRLNAGTAIAAAKAGTPLVLGTGDTVAVRPGVPGPEKLAGTALVDLPPVLRTPTGAGSKPRALEGPASTPTQALLPASPAGPVPVPKPTLPLSYASALRDLTPVTGATPTVAEPRVLDPNVLTAVTTGRLPGIEFTSQSTVTLNDATRSLLSAGTGGDLSKTTTLISPTIETLIAPQLSTTTFTRTLSGTSLTGTTPTTTLKTGTLLLKSSPSLIGR